mgnify:CR=1 FL=1
MNAALFEGAEVQLGAMLAAREARMAAQHGLIKKHNLPVVSFTLNIPGPVKRFALADMLFDSGVDMINRALLSHGIAIADGITRRCETGCEYIAAIDGDAYRAKAALTALEESFPAARLFDMDVITNEFEHVSRADGVMLLADAVECGVFIRDTDALVVDIAGKGVLRAEQQRGDG